MKSLNHSTIEEVHKENENYETKNKEKEKENKYWQGLYVSKSNVAPFLYTFFAHSLYFTFFSTVDFSMSWILGLNPMGPCKACIRVLMWVYQLHSKHFRKQKRYQVKASNVSHMEKQQIRSCNTKIFWTLFEISLFILNSFWN